AVVFLVVAVGNLESRFSCLKLGPPDELGQHSSWELSIERCLRNLWVSWSSCVPH
nr:hypothetical protein [Tanacetum cinerariifolium]